MSKHVAETVTGWRGRDLAYGEVLSARLSCWVINLIGRVHGARWHYEVRKS